jgi:hypothetical protein
VTAGTLRKAALLLASGVAFAFGPLAATGCGSGTHTTEAGLHLQREDLVAAAGALERASREVARETAATKAAWPLIANGLSPSLGVADEAKIATAARAAAALKLPSVFGEHHAAQLTGPGAQISGAYRDFAGLTSRGWEMIEYTLRSQRRGGAAASFARENVALYIESVYDGHFGLSQIGKKLLAGWEKLGGPSGFGSSLPRAQVERLAGLYSERNYRLHPHDGVRLGS